MTKTGATTVILVDGVIMMDGVIEVAAVDGGRDPILTSTSAGLTPPTDTMRILHMGITDTLHTSTTTDTRTEDYAMARPLERFNRLPRPRR
jgi:hypothetical protein